MQQNTNSYMRSVISGPTKSCRIFICSFLAKYYIATKCFSVSYNETECLKVPSKNELTQDILDSIEEGVYTVDKNFRITFFNKAAERITGFNRKHVIGKFCKHVCNSDSCIDRCPIAHVLKTGDSIQGYDCEMVRSSGERFKVKLNSSILYNRANEPDGGVLAFRNISEFEDLHTKLSKATQYHGIVAHNKVMHETFELIEEIADSDASVLIQGESGTGKEMIANAIQITSQRKHGPFVKINCSIFPPQLLASELFGHTKGAFTGAVKDRKGRFEIADTGTIFLDEVAEMTLEMQLQLLRVLQEGAFERVGESVPKIANVRVIAATNKDLKKALESGEFRDDLFYRLNVIPIEIPPLKERPDDIPHLIKHFVEKFSLVYKKTISEISDEAMDTLMRHPWPGNVRELENALEYAFARTKTKQSILLSKLPPKFRQNDFAKKSPVITSNGGKEEMELLQLLNHYQWNKSKVANQLGIGRTTLWRKMKSLGLENSSDL
jgi:PAS domain S-box-containing protein